MKTDPRSVAKAVLVPLIAVAAWETLSRLGKVSPAILPAPSQVLQRMHRLLCGSLSESRTPSGSGKGLSPSLTRSSCSSWMRGSWLTAVQG